MDLTYLELSHSCTICRATL